MTIGTAEVTAREGAEERGLSVNSLKLDFLYYKLKYWRNVKS